MADRKTIFTTPIQTLTRWARGEALTAQKLNQTIEAVNQLLPPIAAPMQVRKVKGYGKDGGGIFSWALLREVNAETRTLKVQRIKYGDADIDEAWETGTYKKVVVSGDIIDVKPAPGSTYDMFNVPKAIRRIEDIDPQTGEKFGWTIYPVKLFADNTIEWAFKLPPGVVEVDPEDEVVSA